MATWSDFSKGLSTNKQEKHLGNEGIAGAIIGAGQLSDMLNDVASADAFTSAAEQLENSLKYQDNYFANAQSTSDLINMAKNFHRIDNITDTFTDTDFYNKDLGSAWIEGTGKGAAVGTGIFPGWGTLAGTVAGFIASPLNYIENQNNAFKQAELANEATARANKAIDLANLKQVQNFMMGVQNVANNNRLSRWSNYAFGGPLHSYGADWRNGLVEINNGGSHEANPFEGVQYGIAQDGQPNLVEEGEVVWNDYVFSNRINAPEDIKKQYKLGGKMNTFADIARYMKERYDERPNDPIAKRTLEDFMLKLAQLQEVERQKAAEQQAFEAYENLASLYADGGNLNRKEDYGSKKKPYPKVNKKDFAGGNRSYPIPTKADAVDALRLAGLHHRPDVKAKVYKKYPELKHALGGHLHWDGDWLDNPIVLPNNNNIVTGLNNSYSWFRSPEYSYVYDQDYINPEENAFLMNQGIKNQNNIGIKDFPENTLYKVDGPKLVPVESSYNIPSYNWYYGMDNPPIVGQDVTAQLPKFEELPETKNTPKGGKAPETKSKTNGWNAAGMAMRLASALGPALGALSAAWSKPDYKFAEDLVEGVNKLTKNMSDISYKPTARYLPYSPMDKAYYMNQLLTEMAARRRADIELSGGNRATALANSKASDIAQQKAIGEVTKAAEDFNRKELERVVSHNMKGDQFDSQMNLEAQKTNAAIREAKARMQIQELARALGWNRQDDMYHSATLAQNLTQLFDNIGGVGTEIMNREQQKALMDSGVWGTLTEMLRRNGFMN